MSGAPSEDINLTVGQYGSVITGAIGGIIIYSLARLTTLMTVIVDMIPMDTNCQFGATISFIFGYTTFAISSVLMILRIIAIWNRNKFVVVLAAIVWAVNVSFLIYGIIQIRPAWTPGPDSCGLVKVESNKTPIITMFITDFILLVVMLVGLLRMGVLGPDTFALGSLLWKQGLIWLLLATTVEFIPVVFISLDLNDAFNMIFLIPSLVIMSVAATRMYRSLTDFGSNNIAVNWENIPRIGPTVSNPKSTLIVPAPPKRMEVAVHMTREKYTTSLTNQNVFRVDHNCPGQLHAKQDGLSFDIDMESGM